MSAPVPAPVTFQVRWGAASDAGLRRRENEDAYLAKPPIFVVADGMGGHARGREASARVVSSFDASIDAEWVTPHQLNDAVRAAYHAVAELSEGTRSAPGSTASGVGLAVHHGQACWLVFNVGDSRTYRAYGDELEQVTIDHSRVQQLRDRGLSSEDATALAPENIITRAIGAGARIAPQLDQWVLPARAGERILVCSDGLTGELTDQLIAALLRTNTEPQAAAHGLVEAAVAAGGRDNVTAVVIEAVEVVGADPGADRLEGDTVNDDDALGSPGDTLPDDVLAAAEDWQVDA